MSREEAKRSKSELGKSSGLNLPEPFQTSQGGLTPGHGHCLCVKAFTLSPTGTTEGVGRDMAVDPSVEGNKYLRLCRASALCHEGSTPLL